MPHFPHIEPVFRSSTVVLGSGTVKCGHEPLAEIPLNNYYIPRAEFITYFGTLDRLVVPYPVPGSSIRQMT